MLSQVTPSYATIKISVSAADVLHGTIFRPASRTDMANAQLGQRISTSIGQIVRAA